jgi:hypothetical protein
MQTEKTSIDKFVAEVKDIDEIDYGDFMRKANHALTILTERIYDKSTPKVKFLLNELKDIIQFMPNWNIESTKARIFSIVNELNFAVR